MRIDMITSSSNAQVKQIIQLNKKSRERKKQDVFLVEGLKMFREAPKDRLVKTYVSEKFLSDDEHRKVLEGIEYEVVKDQVFAQMSDTLTPQGILTVVRQYHYKPEQMLRSGKEPFFQHCLCWKIFRIPAIWGLFFELQREQESAVLL